MPRVDVPCDLAGKLVQLLCPVWMPHAMRLLDPAPEEQAIPYPIELWKELWQGLRHHPRVIAEVPRPHALHIDVMVELQPTSSLTHPHFKHLPNVPPRRRPDLKSRGGRKRQPSCRKNRLDRQLLPVRD